MTIDPFPQLANGGDYVIVFGPGDEQPGVGKVAKWLVVYDAFDFDAQGNVILQQAGSPNEPKRTARQPRSSCSLEQPGAAIWRRTDLVLAVELGTDCIWRSAERLSDL